MGKTIPLGEECLAQGGRGAELAPSAVLEACLPRVGLAREPPLFSCDPSPALTWAPFGAWSTVITSQLQSPPSQPWKCFVLLSFNLDCSHVRVNGFMAAHAECSAAPPPSCSHFMCQREPQCMSRSAVHLDNTAWECPPWATPSPSVHPRPCPPATMSLAAPVGCAWNDL